MSIIYRTLNDSTGEFHAVEVPNLDAAPTTSTRGLAIARSRAAELRTAESTVVDELRAFQERRSTAGADKGTTDVDAASTNADALRSIRAELDELAAIIERGESIEATRAAARPPAGAPSLHRSGADTDVDPDRLAPSELVRSARAIVDAEHRGERITDASAEALTAALSDAGETRGTARLALVTGSDAYRTAFGKVLAGGVDAALALTDAERHAYARARAEARSLSLAGQGDALVPLALDPAIALVGGGSISSIRNLATVKVTAAAEYQVVRSAGVVASWKSESDEETDDSPTVTPTVIKAHKGTAFVPFTEELAWDDPSLLDDLGVMLRDAADELTAAAFVTGSGTGDVPQGLVTGLAAIAGSRVTPTTAGVFTPAADPAKLLGAVPPRHRKAAAFLANFSTLNALEGAETENGAKLYPEIGQGQLLRRALHEESFMADTIAPNPATTNLMVAADVAKAYMIVNRLGTVLQIIPHLFGENGRPIGESGLRMVFRCGAAVVAPEAGRVLQITPAA